MLSRKTLLACVITLTGSALLASAQTGPVGGQPAPAVPSPAPSTSTFTEQSVIQALQSLGVNPQEKVVNGNRSYTFQYQKDGWRFDFEVIIIRDQKGPTGYYLVCHLGQLPSNATPAQLVRLLESNSKTAPCFLAVGNGRLMMVLENLCSRPTNMNEVQGNINYIVARVKSSYSDWSMSPPVAQN
jgi:hypothetical protein